jgi:hypothetical protein
VLSIYSLRAFLVKLPPTLVAKESGVSFDTVKRLQAKGGSVGYKGSSLRKVSAYVNTLLTPLLAAVYVHLTHITSPLIDTVLYCYYRG